MHGAPELFSRTCSPMLRMHVQGVELTRAEAHRVRIPARAGCREPDYVLSNKCNESGAGHLGQALRPIRGKRLFREVVKD